MTSLRTMPTKIDAIAKGIVNKFLNIGDSDDLLQDAYLIYRKCLNRYDRSKKTKFSTYFSICLKNHFIDMRRVQEDSLTLDQPVSYIEDSIEHLTTVIDNVSDGKWSPEEYLLWDSIVTKAESYLSGIALEVFRLKLSAPSDLVLIKDGKEITLNEAIVRGYGRRKNKKYIITRKDMKEIDLKLRKAVLLALDYTPEEVLDFLYK